jgi:hypothetical protein
MNEKKTAEKTLGDVIREALERASKTRAEGAAEAEQCNCFVCAGAREAEAAATTQAAQPAPTDADLKIGSTTLNAKGNHITALFEEEDGAAVLSFSGRGVDFVGTDEGEQGVRFNSREALQEFFTFVTHVEAL